MESLSVFVRTAPLTLFAVPLITIFIGSVTTTLLITCLPRVSNGSAKESEILAGSDFTTAFLAGDEAIRTV